MSNQTISSDLVADLSLDEQQLLSGGSNGVIRTTGTFNYNGRGYPATIDIRVRNLP
jgi:hypothetical protein